MSSWRSTPTILALHKRDYLVIEKLLFAWWPMRKLFSYHLHMTSRILNYMIPVLFVRLARAVAEPIRFQWALAENLRMLVLNYILPNGFSLRWILLCRVSGLLITAVQEIRYRKQYLALENCIGRYLNGGPISKGVLSPSIMELSLVSKSHGAGPTCPGLFQNKSLGAGPNCSTQGSESGPFSSTCLDSSGADLMHWEPSLVQKENCTR
eukprot:gene19365-26013_t